MDEDPLVMAAAITTRSSSPNLVRTLIPSGVPVL